MPHLRLSIEHGFLYDGTGRIWPPTPEQLTVLVRADHLAVVEVLADGDLLVLDTGVANLEAFPDGHFGPYVLASDGKIQDVNYHYRYSHGIDVPAYSNRPVRFTETACICNEPDQLTTRPSRHSGRRHQR
jgi:hypothetical protein